MLINRRNGLMAGKRLPYDAEVEYLKGTGSQYVNTGIKTANDVDISVLVNFDASDRLCWYFGAEEASVKNCVSAYFYASGNTRFTLFCLGKNYATANVPLQSGWHTVQAGVSGVYYDSVMKMAAPISPFLSWYGDILLFTANRGGSPNLNETSTVMIGGATIKKDGVIISDFIPVRRTLDGVSVGEMYDRVTGTFMERHGTFVIGPDVASGASAANGGGV